MIPLVCSRDSYSITIAPLSLTDCGRSTFPIMKNQRQTRTSYISLRARWMRVMACLAISKNNKPPSIRAIFYSVMMYFNHLGMRDVLKLKKLSLRGQFFFKWIRPIFYYSLTRSSKVSISPSLFTFNTLMLDLSSRFTI